MAEQLPKFGDMNGVDIMSKLIDPDGAEYGENPVYLHSQVLRKSEFYEVLLSDRWSSDKCRPLEISLTASNHSVEEHTKCIQLMYSSAPSKRLHFSSVDDALAILPVASQLLFQECVEEFLQYLNAVHWNRMQEAQIRVAISSLQLTTLPVDLSARLCMNLPAKSDVNVGLQTFLAESIQELLFTVPKDPNYGSEVEKIIVSCFEATDPLSPVAVTCKCALVKQFSVNVEIIKCDMVTSNHIIANSCTNLLWLVEVIQRCDMEWFEIVLNMFSHDACLHS